MATYTGNEPLIVNGSEINITMTDYWRWAYSDLTDNVNRSVFAKFLVASALEIITLKTDHDLLTKEGYKVEVKSAAYVQTHDIKHPDCISFSIAPARNSDVYVFCIYKALLKDQSPLDTGLWDLYILSTKTLDEKKPTQKTITLPSLMLLEPIWCDYNGLTESIKKAMTA